jgi:hypothetical protein
MDVAKVLISLDDRLLRRIDRAAAAKGLSRSAYFARLAEREMASETGPGADPKVHATLRKLDRLFAEAGTSRGDSTALIREDRDSH